MAATATKPALIALASIRIDGGTQSRASLNQQTIEDYADEMLGGAEFPPIVVFFDGTNYWLADGFHRWYAARKADQQKIACEVKQGTQRDAILYSVGANSEHGQRRSNADKRRAVELLLNDEEWAKKSDRWIAEKCGVSNRFASVMRGELCTVHSSEPTTGQDGKTRRRPEPRHDPIPDMSDAWQADQQRKASAIVSDVDEWQPAESSVEPESDAAPVLEIPKRTVHRQPEIELSDFGKCASSIEAQIGLLIQECGEHTPDARKAFNFGEGIKKLRFAEKIVSEAKALL